MSENILIIAFKFPPLGGIRIKRMTMFAKYLAQKGYRVHIITVNWRVDMPDTYLDEIQHPNIVIHRIPSWGPHNLIAWRPKKLLGRVWKKIGVLFARLIYFVDEAQWWGISLLPFATRLITAEKITNVVCTGAPFMANYWAARLKAKLPHINLIQDFRDPWNDHLAAPYNNHFLFEWQKQRSIKYEQYALIQADVVVAVTNALTQRFQAKTGSRAKFVTINNGYDPQRYDHLVFEPSKDKMRLVYIGNLGVGRDEVIQGFLPTILELADLHPEFGQHFELVTYGYFPPRVIPQAAPLLDKGLLQINNYVAPDQALQIAQNAFALLLVNAKIFPYLVSGKVYEYIALERPIYALTTEGELAELMRRGNLGFIVPVTESETQKKCLLELFKHWKEDPTFTLSVSPTFRKQFQYNYLVDQLTAYFITKR